MNEKELLRYNEAQIDAITRYRGMLSRKLGREIDESSAAMEWIHKYSDSFRRRFLARHPFNHT